MKLETIIKELEKNLIEIEYLEKMKRQFKLNKRGTKSTSVKNNRQLCVIGVENQLKELYKVRNNLFKKMQKIRLDNDI